MNLDALARRHLRAGFVALLAFVLLGSLLETLHAFKVPLYLDVGNDTRRLMWRLAHAHGAMLSVVNILYALTLERFAELASARSMQLASRGLLTSLVLLPFGFFAGGVVVHGGDPGLPIVLVPIGALALVAALGSIALTLLRR